mmetsp:Transcript_56122/g.93535  ORF Transcript_56122/g.93535 Transcript_56122/m.93535 type:complete len:146 (+) Transcript_56122:26-463(+)
MIKLFLNSFNTTPHRSQFAWQLTHRYSITSMSKDNLGNNDPVKIDTTQLNYVVDAQIGKISALFGGKQAGFIEFDLDGKASKLNIRRTVTEEAYRGNGIAALVTKQLFDYAVEQKYDITSDCWYTPKWISKPQNSDYTKIFHSKL